MPASLVKLVAFLLYDAKSDAREFDALLEQCFGPMDFRGTPVPFLETTYYEPEMGGNLCRKLVSFRDLVAPEDAVKHKKIAQKLEQELAQQAGGVGRVLNIDTGYLDSDKLVLPSCKQGPFKVYWGEGIWLDMLLYYRKGAYFPFDWSFKDFAQGCYNSDLLKVREKYKAGLRKATLAGNNL
jgi:hypothetical protein